jgi:3D-(3,5/4)-trihydroxycyclohexane-1,2-dione acylhydrolase (decyclizing)
VPVTTASVMKGFSWWDVPPAAVSNVPAVVAARAAHERAKLKQRFYY